MRERTDKSFPNGYKTAMGVCQSINEPVTTEILLNFINHDRWRESDLDLMPPPHKMRKTWALHCYSCWRNILILKWFLFITRNELILSQYKIIDHITSNYEWTLFRRSQHGRHIRHGDSGRPPGPPEGRGRGQDKPHHQLLAAGLTHNVSSSGDFTNISVFSRWWTQNYTRCLSLLAL